MVKDIESQTGIIKALVFCIEDTRHQSCIGHSPEKIVAQRVCQIVTGYKDAKDCLNQRQTSAKAALIKREVFQMANFITRFLGEN